MTPYLAEHRHQIVIANAGADGQSVKAALLAAGITDIVILDDHLRPCHKAISSVFDDDIDTWIVKTAGGKTFQAEVVIVTHPWMLVPWIPNLPGGNSFHGTSFHAAEWDPSFDPANKRIAVIGTDATSGYYIGRLTGSSASVTIFTYAPRRVVPEIPLATARVKRWLRQHTRPPQPGRAPTLVTSPIDTITSAGILTTDGVEHGADVIVYGTGFAVSDPMPDKTLIGSDGLTMPQTWENGMEPYLGIAVHGFPNCFFITGPDIGAQAHYVVECVKLFKRTGSTRIEVRRSSQHVFNERAHLKAARPHRLTSAFDLSSGAVEDSEDKKSYDGTATLTIDGTHHPVRVRLTGHLDPNDGLYHWQGTVFDPLPESAFKQARVATLTVGDHSARARIVEQTPWGTRSVAGVGAPPYALTP